MHQKRRRRRSREVPGVKLGIRKPRDLGQQNQCVREELNSDVVFLFLFFCKKEASIKAKLRGLKQNRKNSAGNGLNPLARVHESTQKSRSTEHRTQLYIGFFYISSSRII
jgi:hypothetical protein